MSEEETTPPPVEKPKSCLDMTNKEYSAARANYLNDKANKPKKMTVNAGTGSALGDSPAQFLERKKQFCKGQV